MSAAGDDAIRVLFVDDDADFLDLASRLLEREADRIDLITESSPAEAASRVRSTGSEIDCVVSDYKMTEMDGLELLKTVRSDEPALPFILFTAKGDEELASESIRAGATDYVINTGSPDRYTVLANRIETVVGRRRSERLADRHRRIDSIYRSISQAVLDQPTKRHIEEVVCDSLTDFEGYTIAWIGDITSEKAIDCRSWSGPDGNQGILEDGGTPPEILPEVEAIESDTMRVVDDVQERPAIKEAHPLADEIDVRSVITIPVSASGVTYGGMTIYSETPSVVSDPEIDMLSDLADLIGFALMVAEQQLGMLSYEMTEIELTTSDPSTDLIELSGAVSATVRLERCVRREDGQFVSFLTVGPSAADPDSTADAIEGILGSVESRRVEAGDGTTEWSVVHPTWFGERFTRHGVRIKEAVAEGGTLRIVLERPPTVDIQNVVDMAEAVFDEVEVTAKRQRPRRDTGRDPSRSALADLTPRQQDVLETAYREGFFSWPRETTAEEAADVLDISQPAFSRHIRRSEQQVFGQLIERTGDEPE